MQYKYKLGFIGGGNMAKAILNGILSDKILNKNEIIVADPFFKEDNLFGAKVICDNSIVFDECEYVLFAIKPQVFKEICPNFGEIKSKYIISIMAGVTSDYIKKFIHKDIIRIMPNTPCAIGEGMSVISCNGVEKPAAEFVKTIFESIGRVQFLDEKYFDAVTSVSGSGPAYVYYFVQSMINGGVQGGLDFETSKALTLQTFYGACKMIENSNENIDILIERVCSKGGTTIQAVEHFRNSKLDTIIEKGIEKCKIRSEELSK